MTTNASNAPKTDMHYLQLLSQSFPTIADASTEIINLKAILALPKGTEHFLADIHGENEAFEHVLKMPRATLSAKWARFSATPFVSRKRKNYAPLSTIPSRSWN